MVEVNSCSSCSPLHLQGTVRNRASSALPLSLPPPPCHAHQVIGHCSARRCTGGPGRSPSSRPGRPVTVWQRSRPRPLWAKQPSPVHCRNTATFCEIALAIFSFSNPNAHSTTSPRPRYLALTGPTLPYLYPTPSPSPRHLSVAAFLVTG